MSPDRPLFLWTLPAWAGMPERGAAAARHFGAVVAVADRVHQADDEEPPGGKDRHRPGCGGELRYCFEFDAAYCPACDVWTESSCSDPACDFCGARPTWPSGAHWSVG